MTRFRVLTAIGVLALTFGLVPAAQAQNYFSLSYWPAGFTWTQGGATLGEWNTGFIVLDYSGVFRGPFGLRASFATGGQSGWSGAFAGTTTGTDTIWSADVFFQRATGNFAMRPFIGYGSMRLDNQSGGGLEWDASGFRIGAEFITMTGTPFQFVAAAAWYPSMSLSSEPGGFTGGAGTGFDWNLGVRWQPPAGNWGVTLGYRGAGFSCDSGFCADNSTNWSGLFIGVSIQR